MIPDNNQLIQELSLVEQSAYLGNHHMYGSARLGITTYQPAQHEYRWNYLHGITDTFPPLLVFLIPPLPRL